MGLEFGGVDTLANIETIANVVELELLPCKYRGTRIPGLENLATIEAQRVCAEPQARSFQPGQARSNQDWKEQASGGGARAGQTPAGCRAALAQRRSKRDYSPELVTPLDDLHEQEMRRELFMRAEIRTGAHVKLGAGSAEPAKEEGSGCR